MIIVTGAAGFIGSNLVRGLNRRGVDDLVLVDSLENGEKHLGLNSLEFSDFIDIADFLEKLPALGKVDAILHQGACSDTMEPDGRYMLRTNYEYSKTLMEFALERRIPYLYASSASVYGNGDDGFRESPECEYPLNVYAFSKFLFDRWVRPRLAGAESQVVGLRYFNVYGPQENHKGRMASVVFHFHNQIRETGKLKIFEGSDGFRRDFVHVDDIVDLNLFFLDHPEKSGIFNAGTGRAESFLALAEATQRHYDGARIETIPFPEALVGKYQAYTQADLTQLREAGYENEFLTVEQGVERYVAVLQESEGYYR